VLGRWGGPGETAGDWRRVTDLVALFIAAAWLAGGPVDKRLVRSLQELHLQVDRRGNALDCIFLGTIVCIDASNTCIALYAYLAMSVRWRACNKGSVHRGCELPSRWSSPTEAVNSGASQVPLLHIHGAATAPPAGLLSRLLPAGAAALLPSDFLQVSVSQSSHIPNKSFPDSLQSACWFLLASPQAGIAHELTANGSYKVVKQLTEPAAVCARGATGGAGRTGSQCRRRHAALLAGGHGVGLRPGRCLCAAAVSFQGART